MLWKMWRSDRSKAQFCCFYLTTVSRLAQLELSHGLAPVCWLDVDTSDFTSLGNTREWLVNTKQLRTQRPSLYCNIGKTQSPAPVINQLPNPELNSASRRKVGLRFSSHFHELPQFLRDASDTIDPIFPNWSKFQTDFKFKGFSLEISLLFMCLSNFIVFVEVVEIQTSLQLEVIRNLG